MSQDNYLSLFTNIPNIILKDKEDFEKEDECMGYRYSPSIIPKKDRIIVLGDLHGDFGLTIKCLELAKVVNRKVKNNKLNIDNYEWIGGKTVVVQVGDKLDSCRALDNKCEYPASTTNDVTLDTDLIKFFIELNIIAEEHGGAVYSLLGNHELMNVQGNLNYVSYNGLVSFSKQKGGSDVCEYPDIKEDAEFKRIYQNITNKEIHKIIRNYEPERTPRQMYGNPLQELKKLKLDMNKDKPEKLNIKGGKYIKYNENMEELEAGKKRRKLAFKPGNEYAKMLACSNKSALIIGSFLFVHAGIIPEFIEQLGIEGPDDIYKINYAVRKWLLGLINMEYVDKIVSSSNAGSMFWDRILGTIPPNVDNNDPICIKYLDPVLKLFNVGNMVVGHTPQYFAHKHTVGINSTCGNKLHRVDIGASEAFEKFDLESSDLRKAQVLEILNDSIINIIK